MFDLPDAKRVRRSDLQTSPQSSRASTPDPETLALFRSKLSFEEITTSVPATAPQPAETDSEEELEFRLFAPTKTGTDATSTAPAQTIRIKSPEVEDTEPGLVNPERARSYYFSEVSEVKTAEFAIAAVTGEDVRKMARTPCPGCTYDWKVITLPASRDKTALPNAVTEAFVPDAEKKRKRAGKKLRIKRRLKAEEVRKKREEESKTKEEKEVSERAKRARRNREKKLKKRARDKAKKAAGRGGDVGGEQSAGDDGGSDGDDMSE